MTAEMQERLQRLRVEFDEIDANHDQQLTFQEVQAFLSRKGGETFDQVLCQELFARMDKDNDALVTVEEFILSYVQVEEMLQRRIEQLGRQMTENRHFMEEAQRKQQDSSRSERLNAEGVMVGSVLTCHVREAKGLKTTGVRGSYDPYAVLTTEKQRIETKYVPGEVNPVWDEVFTFQIEHKTSDLKIGIFSRSTLGEGVFLGLVQVPLSSIEDQLKHDSYFDLKGKSGEPVFGKIRLGLQWIWSKTKYFDTIVKQWEANLETDRQEWEHLKEQLRKLDQPFGFLLEGNSNQAISIAPSRVAQLSALELNFEVKIEEVLTGSLGKAIDWDWASLLSLLIFLSISVFTMFARPGFPDVVSTQVLLSCWLFYLWSSQSKSAAAYKAIAGGIVLSEVIDIIWFLSLGGVMTM